MTPQELKDLTRMIDYKSNYQHSVIGSKPVENLTCCVCAGDAGKWKQHWNRDTGYGVCNDCVTMLRFSGYTEETITDYYGTEGINWGKSPSLTLDSSI